MLSVRANEEKRRNSRFGLLSSSPNSSRRGSKVDETATISRSPRPPRHRPILDEATLAARQHYAAHGVITIKRRTVAKRRRFFREQTSVMSESGDVSDGGQQTAAVGVVVADDDEVGKAPQTMTNSYIISAIPYMPKSVAALCLILNILLPGTGTMLSGLTAFCCGRSRMESREHNSMSVFCVNLMVGTMQLFTVTFLLVGWAWSLVWGIYMVILAEEHRKETKAMHEKELQAKALIAMNGQLRAWTMVSQKD